MINLKKIVLSILFISSSLFSMDAPGIKTCCSTVGDKPYFSVILEKIKSLSENKALSDSAKIDEINKNLKLICSNLEKSKDEKDSEYGERLRLCMVVNLIDSIRNTVENQEHSLAKSLKTLIDASETNKNPSVDKEVNFDRVNVEQNIVFKKDNIIYAGKAKNDIQQGRVFITLEERCDENKKTVICMKIGGFVIDPEDNKVGLAADETIEDKFYKATIKAGKKVQLAINYIKDKK
ncbi:hypothetical protein N5912_00660 [Arcobacter lacus]|uniref:hypothetical protein n=1 Tax=Arcobacter lacus TaxID=1912876 RepID=UPI0021BB1572|nr:hypothetical protein [Arcobacter lacus]MCT7910329.1 hypothetical protein [Arcobacter lacus]